MTTRGRLHDLVHRHAKICDVALALVLLIPIVLAPSYRSDMPGASNAKTLPVLALEALIFVALLLRRDRPILVLGFIVLAVTSVMLLGKGWSPIAVAAVVAVFTVASRRDRGTTVAAAVGAGLCLMFGGAVRTGDWFTTYSVSTLAWTGFAAALGQAIRSQKAYVAAVEERALRAEQTREEEAGRRVIEERLRIARELHDVVAHHIAVIQVQAAVVDHLMTEHPTAAREALGHVRRSSKMVLDELGGMLDVLRQPDDPLTPTDPAPGLARLVTLIDEFGASGLQVDWRISGPTSALPSAVDLVAYRLVQEGLTNAHKHGTGSAEMVLGFEPGMLVLTLVNRVAVPVAAGGVAALDQAAPSLGHGLAGMRERAHAVGGSVSAARRSDGTWQVVARLPLDGDDRSGQTGQPMDPAARATPQTCRRRPS